MSANIGQQMQDLYRQFGGLQGVTIELHKELLAIQVNNQAASATIFLQGAQLSHYQRHNEKATIWCSDLCDFQQGTPLRGGIPICWPWFGDLNRNPATVKADITHGSEPIPPHGFVRNRLWALSAIDIPDDQHTQLSFQLSLAENEEPLWPYACDLTMVITVGAELNVNFQVSNSGNSAFTFTSALHTYFAVDAIEGVNIEGLDQQCYIDCLDEWHEKTQQGPIIINQEIDRIYRTGSTIKINEGDTRSIALQSQGSNSTVVWNPWVEKAKRLSHFADQAYREMLCIETANAEQDSVSLEPGQQHHLSLTISSNA